MKDLGSIYSEEWFRVHYRYKDEFRALAEIVESTFRPIRSVLDVGCGASLLLERLHELGLDVFGIDGSPHARNIAPPAVRDRVSIVRIEDGDRAVMFVSDLVICTEVAEHVEPDFADTLVALLAKAAKGAVYFTAAPPGQGGTDHVNEQPPAYWLERFARYGFALDELRTAGMRARIAGQLQKMVWYAANSMVLTRPWPRGERSNDDGSEEKEEEAQGGEEARGEAPEEAREAP